MELNLQLNNKKVGEDHWEVVHRDQCQGGYQRRRTARILFILEIEHAGSVFCLKMSLKQHMATGAGASSAQRCYFLLPETGCQPGFCGWRFYAVSRWSRLTLWHCFQNAQKNRRRRSRTDQKVRRLSANNQSEKGKKACPWTGKAFSYLAVS